MTFASTFNQGEADSITKLLVEALSKVKMDGDLLYTVKLNFIIAIIQVLVWRRDNDGLALNVDTLKDAFDLENCIRLSKNERIPHMFIHDLKRYLSFIPGYLPIFFDQDGKMIQEKADLL